MCKGVDKAIRKIGRDINKAIIGVGKMFSPPKPPKVELPDLPDLVAEANDPEANDPEAPEPIVQMPTQLPLIEPPSVAKKIKKPTKDVSHFRSNISPTITNILGLATPSVSPSLMIPGGY